MPAVPAWRLHRLFLKPTLRFSAESLSVCLRGPALALDLNHHRSPPVLHLYRVYLVRCAPLVASRSRCHLARLGDRHWKRVTREISRKSDSSQANGCPSAPVGERRSATVPASQWTSRVIFSLLATGLHRSRHHSLGPRPCLSKRVIRQCL